MKCLRVYMNLVRLLNEDNFLFKLISSLNFPTKPDPDRKQICLFTYAVSPMTPQTATTLPKAQLSRNHPNPKASPNSYRSPKHTPPPYESFRLSSVCSASSVIILLSSRQSPLPAPTINLNSQRISLPH
jgi:hypothetical protein